MADIQGVPNVSSPTGTPPAPAPVKTAAPASPALAGDQLVSGAPGRGAIPAIGVMTAPPANLQKFFRGFHAGDGFDVSAEGFMGSGMVGGQGRVQALSPTAFKLAMHIEAPGPDRDVVMSMTWNGQEFVGREGGRFKASLSPDGDTLTFTDQANAKRQMVLMIPRSGELHLTTRGFGNDGRTLVAKSM